MEDGMSLTTWRKLEAEIISILQENNFTIIHNADSGDTLVELDHDYRMTFSLTTFAKELAQRLDES
jgi:hypothetical protein